mmetsp:Transcript_23608/g.61623  ORF Transcript_23608/g.61623 Transcript_23608/m.61623 type:complete len:254 (+) Transcript_23608:296-1057(+)
MGRPSCCSVSDGNTTVEPLGGFASKDGSNTEGKKRVPPPSKSIPGVERSNNNVAPSFLPSVCFLRPFWPPASYTMQKARAIENSNLMSGGSSSEARDADASSASLISSCDRCGREETKTSCVGRLTPRSVVLPASKQALTASLALSQASGARAPAISNTGALDFESRRRWNLGAGFSLTGFSSSSGSSRKGRRPQRRAIAGQAGGSRTRFCLINFLRPSASAGRTALIPSGRSRSVLNTCGGDFSYPHRVSSQ